MAITVELSPRAQRDIDDLDASIKPDVDRKLESLRANWPDVPKKPLTGPWRLHFRIQVRKNWRIIVKPESGRLTVVGVFPRGSRGYDEGSRDASREEGFVVVPRRFVTENMRGRPTRNFASEYVRWSLGRDLLAMRRRAGFGQQELASKIGKGQSTVSMAEKGSIRVSSAYVRAVMRACRIPPGWRRGRS